MLRANGSQEMTASDAADVLPENMQPPDERNGRAFDYRLVFEASRDAMLVADAASGMLVDANPAAVALLGRSLNEIRALHQTDVHSVEDVEAGREAFGAYRYQSGCSAHVLKKVDGTCVPVEVSASVMRDVNGRELILGIFRDLTAQRRAEKELRE